MTKKEWERRFLRGLRALPSQERQNTLAYYLELYGDKAELGLSETEILEEFGQPELCAARILAENEMGGETQNEPPKYATNEKTEEKNGYSVGEIIGVIFFTLLLILPIAISIGAAALSFGVASLACAICSVAGGIYSVLSPFVFSGSAAGAFMHLGLGLTAGGICLLLAIGFYFATKYTAIALVKTLQFIYKRR